MVKRMKLFLVATCVAMNIFSITAFAEESVSELVTYDSNDSDSTEIGDVSEDYPTDPMDHGTEIINHDSTPDPATESNNGIHAEIEMPPLIVLLEKGEITQLSMAYDSIDNGMVIWSSSNTDVAEVDEAGNVTAVDVGEAEIYAEIPDGSIESIFIKVVGEGFRLAINVNISDSKRLYLNEDMENITWISSDETIATVSERGKVTGVAKGLVMIKAEYQGDTYGIYVRVSE